MSGRYQAPPPDGVRGFLRRVPMRWLVIAGLVIAWLAFSIPGWREYAAVRGHPVEEATVVAVTDGSTVDSPAVAAAFRSRTPTRSPCTGARRTRRPTGR